MTLKTLTLAGILGLSLTTLANAPVYAQDMSMDSPWTKLSDEEIDTPVRMMSYPMASPGSLHLMHWHGYNEQAMMEGSVDDIRYERERRMNKMYMDVRKTYWDKMSADQKMHEEEMGAEPVSMDYTMASPGSLHLMHWHGIDRQKWMEGSVSEMRYMQEEMKDKMWYGEKKMTMWTDEDAEHLREPLAMSYPMAAPASLHLYHWMDYTRWDLMEGSVNDHRYDREMMMDKKMMSERKAMDTPRSSRMKK